MTRLLSDSFTESADKPLGAHTPETGGAWAGFSGATMTVLAAEGRVRGSDAASTAIYYNSGALAANLSVAATVRRTTTTANEGSPGVALRLQTSGDSRYVAVHTGSQLQLQKRVAGTTTTIATASPNFPVDTDCTLELRANGSELIVLWNGAAAISTSDAAIGGAGYAAIACRLNGRVDMVTADTIAWALAPAKATHAASSDPAAIGVGYGLAPAKGALAGSADLAPIGIAYSLAPVDATSGQRAGASALAVAYALSPGDAAQPFAYALSPGDAAQPFASDAAAIAVTYGLTPSRGVHSLAGDAAALAWIAPFKPDRAVLMVTSDPAALRRALAPPGAGIAASIAADPRGLRIEQDFRTEEIRHG